MAPEEKKKDKFLNLTQGGCGGGSPQEVGIIPIVWYDTILKVRTEKHSFTTLIKMAAQNDSGWKMNDILPCHFYFYFTTNKLIWWRIFVTDANFLSLKISKFDQLCGGNFPKK